MIFTGLVVVPEVVWCTFILRVVGQVSRVQAGSMPAAAAAAAVNISSSAYPLAVLPLLRPRFTLPRTRATIMVPVTLFG